MNAPPPAASGGPEPPDPKQAENLHERPTTSLFPPELGPDATRPPSTQDWVKKELSSKKKKLNVPGYEILGELGRGGMGVVFKARQIGLDRVVALKMVLGGTFAQKDDFQRLRSEAAAIARLQHPNIVQVHEVDEHDGCPYFSLEYVD